MAATDELATMETCDMSNGDTCQEIKEQSQGPQLDRAGVPGEVSLRA